MMMMNVTLMTVETSHYYYYFNSIFSIWNDYRMYTLYAAHSLQLPLSLLDSSVLIDFNNYRIAFHVNSPFP